MRFHAVAFALALGGLLPAAGIAHAQDTGSLVRPEPGEIPDGANERANLRQGMFNIATCAFQRRRIASMTYLRTFPGTRQSYDQATDLVREDCLASGGIRFDERTFRGAMFQAAYRDAFGREMPGDLSAVPAIDYTQGIDLTDEALLQEVAMRRFGDCVSRAAPREVHVLIQSYPESANENAAFDALAPFFSGCLTADLTLRFSKIRLRAVLAETLYRIRSAGPQEN